MDLGTLMVSQSSETASSLFRERPSLLVTLLLAEVRHYDLKQLIEEFVLVYGSELRGGEV